MDLNSLLNEAQQMLSSVGEVITSTMQQGVEVVKDYEELASNKVSDLTKEKKKELADISTYGESLKSCVEKSENDFEKAEEKLRKELAACYKKHYGSLDKILSEKETIHEEARQIKNELEQQMTNCLAAANKAECFLAALNSLKKRVKAITSRVAEILKKESLARVKASKAVYDCDQKVMDEAYKKFTSIIDQVKKCAAKQK